MKRIISLIFLICLLASCGEPEPVYHITAEQFAASDVELSEVKFFIETSASMKGYVKSERPGNFTFKKIVPELLTIVKEQFQAPEIYTITEKPEIYRSSQTQFNEDLRTAEIFDDHSSPLHLAMGSLIDSTDESTLTVFISDCILDIGANDNLTQLEQVSTLLYTKLQGKDIGVAVYQYLSDFNGQDITLTKRPYYVWFFGHKASIRELLSHRSITGYENRVFFNLDYDVVVPLLCKKPKKGMIRVRGDSAFAVNAVNAEHPCTFVLSLDIKNYPQEVLDELTKEGSLRLEPSYMQGNVRILAPNDIEDGETKKEVLRLLEERKHSHLLKVTLSSLTEADELFSIVFATQPNLSWAQETSIDDDFELEPIELEGKTFAFRHLMQAFENRFIRDQDQQPIFQINFQK
jgi:hypothetical protein